MIAATGQDVLRWVALTAYFLIPLLLFALWVGQLVAMRRARKRDEQQTDLIAQQMRALNWLVGEAREELAAAKCEAAAAKQTVEAQHTETQKTMTEAKEEIKQAITESRQVPGGGS